MFRVNSLPATFGDSILIQYGDDQAPHNILIDGGTAGTRKQIEKTLKAYPEGQRHFELVVVSHIDNDHIAGILRLLEEEGEAPEDEKLGFTIGDFWFNGWPQLNDDTEDVEIYGVEQGEKLTKQIEDHGLHWNRKFSGKAIVVPEEGPLPHKHLEGGMLLTVLSPRPEGLAKLKTAWEDELSLAGLITGMEFVEEPVIDGVERFGTRSTGIMDIDELASSEFDPDGSDANRSSIALIAEYENKRLLLAADAHAEVLQAGLRRYQPEGKVDIDLFKVSHHGAQGTTNLDLINIVNCKRYLFSTNGSNYYHPHAESISRVIVASGNNPELIFNYKTQHNNAWEEMAAISGTHKFQTFYPQDNKSGISVKL